MTRNRPPKLEAIVLRPRKPRPSDSVHGHVERVLCVGPILTRMAEKYIKSEKPQSVRRVRGGPKPHMTDDQIREMRRQYDTGRHTFASLAEAFGVSIWVARNVCLGITRAKVI